ncbi:MAG: class I SAM-dependent methyltransferase [Steroidobacteraceae bacterium]
MRSHEQTVHTQFDPRAEAYLHSAVHAAGPDLEYVHGLLGQCAGLQQGLDVGCGAGHLSFAIAPHVGRVVALDPSANMLAAVTRGAAARGFSRIETRCGSAESLPFAPESFALVCTRYSAHHWTRLAAAVLDMSRVLEPGGRALIIDVVAPEDPLVDTHFQAMELLRDPSHVRDRSVREWRELLAPAGLEELEYHQWPVRIEFRSWVERMRTPEASVVAIRTLQSGAPREVQDALALEVDGSFVLQTGLFWLVKAGRP